MAVHLPSIGFGCAGLGNLSVQMSEDDAHVLLETAWDAGLRYFDTAPLYGFGLSELRLGQFLRGHQREHYIVSTKVGRYFLPPWGGRVNKGMWAHGLEMEPVADYSYDGVMRSLEQSFCRTGLDRLDIVFIHDVDRRNQGDNYPVVYRQAVEETYRVLDDLRRGGFVSAIGVGLNESDVAADFMKDTDIDLVMLAGRYSLLEQPALYDALPLAQARGIGVVAAGIYNSGILIKGSQAKATYDYGVAPPAVMKRIVELERFCLDHGVSLAAAATQFPLAHPSVTGLVFGFASPQHVASSLGFLETPLPRGFWKNMKRAGLLAEAVPVPED